MSREARIGLLVAVSILVFFLGFYFLKGSNVFAGQLEYKAYYENVQGLQPSAPVQIHGLQVGKVESISLNRAKPGEKVEVIFAVGRKTLLPKGTVAKLTSLDLLGTKGISLDLGTSNETIEEDAILPTAIEGGLMDKISVEATPLLQDVRKVVNSIDSVLNSVNMIFSTQARTDLQQSIAALHRTMDDFSGVASKLNKQSDALGHVIKNADNITTTLANGKLDQTMANLRTTSETLSNAPIESAVKNIDQVAANLNGVIQKINTNEGSLGMMLNDKQLYNNLSATLAELTKLSADLKAHPSRYINLTIFGRRAKVGD